MRKRLIGCLIAMVALLVSGCAPPEYQLLKGRYHQGQFGGKDGVDIFDDTLVIGAEGDTGKVKKSGSAYIYSRGGSTWAQTASLNASDAADGDKFGSSVAIHGQTVVVGAPFKGPKVAGAIYVYVRSGTVWKQQAKLLASGTAYFGTMVDVYGDTLTVTANSQDKGRITGTIAYVYVRSGTVWKQQAQLKRPDIHSISLYQDTLALGDVSAVDLNGLKTGAAYVHTRSGTVWTRQAVLRAKDAHNDQSFGASVSLDQDTLAIGAKHDWHGGKYTHPFWISGFAGAAYVFGRSGSSWSQQAKLVASDSHFYQNFGVVIRLQGRLLLVTAEEQHGTDQHGSVYVFNETGGAWSQRTKLFSDLHGTTGLKYNFGVSLGLDSGTAVVGDFAHVSPTIRAGQVFIYNDLHTQLGVSRMSIATCPGFRAAMGCDGDGPCLPEPGEVIPPELVHHLWTLASDEYSQCSADPEKGCHPDLVQIMQASEACSQDPSCVQAAASFVLVWAQESCGLN